MAAVGGLTVRRYERHEVGLRAILSLTGDSARVIRLSAAAEADVDAIEATLVDIGDGGLGLRTRLMLPRGVTLRVRVPHPATPGAMLLDADARLQRVTMKGREPTYVLGMAFTGVTAALNQQVAELRAYAAANPAPLPKEGSC
jgi:hypothetical protein